MSDEQEESNVGPYLGDTNWNRYLLSHCRRWTGRWTVFDVDSLMVEKSTRVVKRARANDMETSIEHMLAEELLGPDGSVLPQDEEDEKRLETTLDKEEAMQITLGDRPQDKKLHKPYINIKTTAGTFQHLTFDFDQEVMLSWDLRFGEFKCYQFTFKRAGTAHTLCYMHDSDWQPTIIFIIRECTDTRDLAKLPENAVKVKRKQAVLWEDWKGYSKLLRVEYGKTHSTEDPGLTSRELSIKEMLIGPLAYSWGIENNKELSFSNGLTLSIPEEPLKIINGNFSVACEWVASDHEIRQIGIEYSNYLVNELHSTVYRKKEDISAP